MCVTCVKTVNSENFVTSSALGDVCALLSGILAGFYVPYQLKSTVKHTEI